VCNLHAPGPWWKLITCSRSASAIYPLIILSCMQNTMGKRVDEEREEKSRNCFTIRKPSRQATQQNDDFLHWGNMQFLPHGTVHTCMLLAGLDTGTLLLLATTSALAAPCYCSSLFATPHHVDVSCWHPRAYSG